MWFSVTRAIPHDFTGISQEVLDAAAARGTDVHTACSAYLNNLFIPDSILYGDRVGYFNSFRRWYEEYVSSVLYVEHEFKCDRFKFLGHVDLVAELIDGRFVVVDLKTPAALAKTWRMQLAAYRYLVAEELRKKKIKVPKLECMSLRLLKNGDAAKAELYQDNENDFVVFLSSLNVTRFLKS